VEKSSEDLVWGRGRVRLSTKTCVACAEEIKTEAVLCKHCGVMQNDHRFDGEKANQSLLTSRLSFFKRLRRSTLVLILVGIVLAVGAGFAAIQYLAGHYETKCTTIRVPNPNYRDLLFAVPNNPRYFNQDQCTEVWSPGPPPGEVTGVDAD
jgi:hypothetical protein